MGELTLTRFGQNTMLDMILEDMVESLVVNSVRVCSLYNVSVFPAKIMFVIVCFICRV